MAGGTISGFLADASVIKGKQIATHQVREIRHE
jgi:hypothetical protein